MAVIYKSPLGGTYGSRWFVEFNRHPHVWWDIGVGRYAEGFVLLSYTEDSRRSPEVPIDLYVYRRRHDMQWVVSPTHFITSREAQRLAGTDECFPSVRAALAHAVLTGVSYER